MLPLPSPQQDFYRSSTPVVGGSGPAGASSESADLTTWFLNAKRSLSSITLCERAHVLVDSARAALQEASVISARCLFLRNALQDQLTIAGQVSRMMRSTQNVFRTEFEKTLNELDNADIRLNDTLELLRNSPVHPAFITDTETNGAMLENGEERAKGRNEGSEDRDSESSRNRTLHDFVEDEGIENLKSKLRHCIDYVQESHDALQAALGAFDDSLHALTTSVSTLPDASPSSQSLHAPLHALEENTECMAGLLESLTQHFDQCSLALRSAESHTPIDGETFAVLGKDAGEVDDVVKELSERLAEMEDTNAGIQNKINDLHNLERDTISVFADFEHFQGELGICLDNVRDFEGRQVELKSEMETRLEELWQLGEFYDGFVGAYDAMIIEVGRRKGVGARMEQVVKDAVKTLHALYEEDLQDREIFREEHGQWLPVDIWPGLGDPPIKWQIEKDLQGGRELPKLTKDVIEKAMRRVPPGKGRV
ncbi:autophagy-related protein 17 [Geopyxis carbonaria]|nr:autophagy-related protein 17 [Geopyxis carbonaria]